MKKCLTCGTPIDEEGFCEGDGCIGRYPEATHDDNGNPIPSGDWDGSDDDRKQVEY